MAIGVRDYLENLGHTVGYDKKTGDVLVKNEKGKMTSIGSDGFTLKDDGRYYAENESDILNALSKNNISAKIGFSPVRSALSPANTVGYNEKTGQVYINGRDYNVDGKNLIKIGDKVYGENNFLSSLEKKEYENKYSDMQENTLNKLLNSKYEGYNPAEDENFIAAFDAFMQGAKEDMGERGIISDSLITHYASQGAESLMPKYAALDYERFLNEQDNLKDSLDIMDRLNENDRQAYKTNADISLGESELLHGREKDISDAAAAERKEEKEDERLEKEHQNKLEIIDKEQQFDREQAERDFEYKKELERLQNDLGISKAQAQAYYKMIYG